MSDHGLLLVHWSHTINAGDLAPRLLRGPSVVKVWIFIYVAQVLHKAVSSPAGIVD